MAEFKDIIEGANKICKYLHDNSREFDCYVCDACEKKFPTINEICRYSHNVLKLKTFKGIETEVQQFLKDHPEPIYPTWIDWLRDNGSKPIPEEIAKKLGVEPVKEEK